MKDCFPPQCGGKILGHMCSCKHIINIKKTGMGDSRPVFLYLENNRREE